MITDTIENTPESCYLVIVNVAEGNSSLNYWYDIRDWCYDNLGNIGTIGWDSWWDKLWRRPSKIVHGIWMVTNITYQERPVSNRGIYIPDSFEFAFRNASDAIMFKLVWAGS